MLGVSPSIAGAAPFAIGVLRLSKSSVVVFSFKLFTSTSVLVIVALLVSGFLISVVELVNEISFDVTSS